MKKSVLAGVLAAVMLLSGCSGVSQEEYNSLLEENSKLKENSSSDNTSTSETSPDSYVESSSSSESDVVNILQKNNRINPLDITPQSVSDLNVIMAKILMETMFSSVDEMYLASVEEKRIAQGAINTTLCYLDKKDGTTFYTTEKDVVEKVLFVDDKVDVEKDVVTAAFNTLMKAESTISGSRYSSLDNTVKAMKNTYGESVIGADNVVKLNNDVDLCLLALDCYYLGELNIKDIEETNKALSSISQSILGSVVDSQIKNVKEVRDNAVITISKLAYNVETTDEEILEAEKNIGYLLGITEIGNKDNSSSSTQTKKPTESQTPPTPSATTGEINALKKAKSYLDFSAFSRNGLIGQLEYEGFTNSEATYGADNVGANWNEQALKKAKSYLDFSAFSYNGLVEQLEFEEFTHEQAVYGADKCGADWNEQAAKKAKSYLEFTAFSRDSLINQLEFEGFTHDQAVYGVTQNGY